MGRWWPFGRAVEAARELVEAPAPVVRVSALPTELRAETTWAEEPAPEKRYCVITRVKGQAEHHSICELGLKHEPTGGVVIRTGHWVV